VPWSPPRYNTVHRLLTNPVYAGAYIFGRTGSRLRFEEGRKVITRGVARRRDECEGTNLPRPGATPKNPNHSEADARGFSCGDRRKVLRYLAFDVGALEGLTLRG
jgi:hypothetical protein